jgi:hypothetical protein
LEDDLEYDPVEETVGMALWIAPLQSWHEERGINTAETGSYSETVAVAARPTQRIIKFRVHLQQ